MKQHFNGLILALLTALLSTQALAAAAQQADSLMDLSGMNAQLEGMPGMMEQVVAQQAAEGGMPDWQAQALSTALRQGFDPAQMKRDIRGHIEDNLDDGHADAALDWLQSSLGQRITALEEAADTPEVQAEMMRIMQGGDAGVSERRQALLDRFDAATRASEMSVEMVMGIQRGLLSAVLTAAGAPAEQLDMLMGQAEAARPQIEAAVLQQNQLAFAVIYRELSDAELGKYVTFAESKAGRGYHQAMLEGFSQAMEAAAVRSGEAIAASAGQ